MQKLSSIHDSIDLDRGGGGGGGEEKEVKNTSTVSKKSSLQDTPVLSKKSSTDTLMSRRSSGTYKPYIYIYLLLFCLQVKLLVTNQERDKDIYYPVYHCFSPSPV